MFRNRNEGCLMEEQDKNKLEEAADELREALRSKSLEFNIDIKEDIPFENPNGTDGYLVRIANVDIDLDIYASIDRGKSGEIVFWAGFYSKFQEPIKILEEMCPSKFTPVDVSRQYEKSGTYYYLKDNTNVSGEKPTTIVEYFPKQKANDFGICGRLNKPFDLHASVDFISTIMHGMPKFEEARYVEKPTERRAMIDARRGQGRFREEVKQLWDGKCAVLGITTNEILRASHIKAWQDCNDSERLDRNNGILLSAHLDALFDRFLISFENDGKMVVADVANETSKILNLSGMKLRKRVSSRSQDFLEWHRERFKSKKTCVMIMLCPLRD
jgi:hypothetical protein